MCHRTGCLACETNFFSYGGNCIKSCPSKTYAHEISCLGKYFKVRVIFLFDQDCPDHCTKCDVDKCKVCSDGYQLNSDKKCILSSSSPSSPQSPSTTQVEAGLSGI